MAVVLVPAVLLFGLVIGSFLTVVVARIGTNETILGGRSHCVHCGKHLAWYELLPVLSFFLQGGQCRSCGGKIPRTYPAIELATAALFAAVGWGIATGTLPTPPFLGDGYTGSSGAALAAFLYYAFFATLAVAVSFYDFEHRIIPGALVAPQIAVGASAQVAGGLYAAAAAAPLAAGAVGAGAFLFFWALWFFSGGRAMGRGDADVALAIGLSFQPAVAILGFLLALWLGAAVGILLVAMGRLTWKSQMPFAPFLFGGIFLALFSASFLPLLSDMVWIR